MFAVEDIKSKMGVYRPHLTHTLNEQLQQTQTYLSQLSQEVWHMQQLLDKTMQSTQERMEKLEQAMIALQNQITS